MNIILNEKCSTLENSQKELNRKLNQLEAESKIVLLILQEINKRGSAI
jgi:hypothetical protein